MADRARHRNRNTQRGFTQLDNAVLFNAELSLGARVLYAAMKHYAWALDGEVPSISGLAQALGCSERSLRRQGDRAGYIGELEDNDLLTIERHDGESSTYIIEEPTPAKTAAVTPAEIAAVPRQKLPATLTTQDQASKEASKTRPPRPRDVAWDTLVEVFGEPSNDVERGRRNRSVALVKQSLRALEIPEADWPDEIRKRVARWPQVYERARLTDSALGNRWSELGRKAGTRKPTTRCTGCGFTEPEHAVDCPDQLARRA